MGPTTRERTLSAQSKADAQEQIRLVDSPEPEMENNDNQEQDPTQPVKRVIINRPVMTQTMLSGELSQYQSPRVNPWEFLKKKSCSPMGCLLSLFPILYWLPRYEWKRDITYDLTAGFTVAVMHIPQGMAYALLGNLPPIIGIYMAFFPVIIYSIMGTSRHVSMGTFAVICLMTGKVAAERVTQYNTVVFSDSTLDYNDNDNSTSIEPEMKPLYTITEIATALSLCVGLWQVLMGVFRLGALSLLLSAEVVSGFTTGAAVHVLTSQIKNLFGLKMSGRNGLFKIMFTYRDIATNIATANVTAVIMSTITITALIVYNEILKPHVAAKISFPLPVELFTIIVGTVVSANLNLATTFNITIVDYIPTGLPPPVLPPLQILPDLMVDSLTISIVAYAISISMSKIFALKYNYRLDPNQELIAQGASNMFGGLFSCAPISASLSRSLVQELVGGRTQLAGLFSCGIMVIVLLWIGPFFETLPNCVLSAIIVVALKGMFLQIFDLPKAWKESILNAAIWIITFLVTVLLDIEYGLAAGILLSVLILIWRSNKPHIEVLGAFSDLDLYVDRTHAKSKEIPGRKIIKYTGNLNFATIEHFVKKVEGIVPSHGTPKDLKSKGSQPTSIEIIQSKQDNLKLELQLNLEEYIDTIILDFSGLSSIDPEALTGLLRLFKRYETAGIQCLFAACSQKVLHVMTSCKFINQIGTYNFFPSIHDAVTHVSPAQNQISSETVH